MAGFGMARYHLGTRSRAGGTSWSSTSRPACYTAIVVVIFAVVKFTEGAWLIVIIFPILVFALIRLNREYRAEARVLQSIGERRASGDAPRQPNYTRRVVIVFVDDFDLSTSPRCAMRESLRPTTVRAVHFVIDTEQAERLRAAWLPDRGVSLEFVDCPDRRLARAAADLVSRGGGDAGHAGDRDPAPAQLLAAARQAAARPDRGQDRRRGQPGAERRGHHHPVRRAEPDSRPAGTPGRRGRNRAGQR